MVDMIFFFFPFFFLLFGWCGVEGQGEETAKEGNYFCISYKWELCTLYSQFLEILLACRNQERVLMEVIQFLCFFFRNFQLPE